ncbi:MAG TPA: DUF1957 domain-containing protein [Armatimonadetes bacterium]|nr:DUF1957 domain-containing protein [Armatimonadota bacterium]
MPKREQNEPKSAFTFVLHGHLPYVLAHGTWPHGTDWLLEAACETYIPLVEEIATLVEEGHSPKFTLSLTPVLCEQLADERFQNALPAYAQQKIEAAQRDAEYFARTGQRRLADMARQWEAFYTGVRTAFEERWQRDLLAPLRRWQEEGYLEIITSAATHGYLPLLGREENVRAQIKGGVETYRRHFGCAPRGIWLPECAYRPGYEWSPPLAGAPFPATQRRGLEHFLAEEGIDYFIVDTHLLRGGVARGVYLERFEGLQRLWLQFASHYQPRPEEPEKSPYRPYLVGDPENPPARPVWIFTRDPVTGLQVWSREWGYPGDGWYLDFHKKHWPGGHRYWRVTDSKADLAAKQEYEPERVGERLAIHAEHFVRLASETLAQTGLAGCILVAPYDLELFGHWWFEGVRWLGQVVRRFPAEGPVQLTTCGEYLSTLRGEQQMVSLPEGSWGEGGFHYIWLNQDTEWTWKHIYACESRVPELLAQYRADPSPRRRKVLEQALRELLLLESSDWQFLISTFHARDYAEQRFAAHVERFTRLAEWLTRPGPLVLSPEEWAFYEECAAADALFPQLDPAWWEA